MQHIALSPLQALHSDIGEEPDRETASESGAQTSTGPDQENRRAPCPQRVASAVT